MLYKYIAHVRYRENEIIYSEDKLVRISIAVA